MKKLLHILIIFFSIIFIFFKCNIINVSAKNEYKLTSKDNILIDNFYSKVEEIIQIKGVSFIDNLTEKIDNVLDKQKLTNRVEKILDEINKKIKNIEINIENSDKDYNSYNSENYLSEYNIDLAKVKETWLGRYNEERKKLGKYDYVYNDILEKTAIDWSNTSKQRGKMSHKRNENDSYYDYNKITNWFGERGVVCKNIYKVTHTENIGYGSFYCNDGECTDEFITGIEDTFNFYMGEKNNDYKPHYNSVMNDYFTIMGVGFAIEKNNSNYKYYLTVHYCTELIEK